MSSKLNLIVPAVALGAVGLASLAFIEWFRKRSMNSSGRLQVPFSTYADEFVVSKPQLEEVIRKFLSEMEEGLNHSLENLKGDLKMLPAYVGKPSGNETGIFYALDLGGTNFRVIQLELQGRGVVAGTTKMKTFKIPEQAMKGTAVELFDFIASSVISFHQEASTGQKQTPLKLGFTFSFPVNQTSINSGSLIIWTKGFSTSGVEGHDVVKLLQEAFNRKNFSIEIAALANDTVGTLCTEAYKERNCVIGVILGTGTNACYIEKLENVRKLTPSTLASIRGTEGMIINMEWGAFGDSSNILPRTQADVDVDSQSINPSKQKFEKMISGMYLGTIVRNHILDCCNRNLFSSKWKKLQHSHVDSKYITQILDDTSSGLDSISTIFRDQFQIFTSLEERLLIQTISKAVSVRAARLSAAGIVAILRKIGKTKSVAQVAIDGSVFEHIPHFKENMNKTIKELEPESEVELILTKDGSGVGAAIIAAITSSNSS